MFFDLSTGTDNGDGTSTIDGWFNVVWDAAYENTESCKTSTVIDMISELPTDDVNVLAHEWNYNCSYEGQNLQWTDAPESENGLLLINGDNYQMYEYDDIYGVDSTDDWAEWADELSADEISWLEDKEKDWEVDYQYQELYLFPQGADLIDWFTAYAYPNYSVFSTEIDTESDPMTAAFIMYIYHDENYEKKE